MAGIFRLKGSVKNYDWGGYSFIPDLLGIQNKDRIPYAEYWMGAHPQSPSTIIRSGKEEVFRKPLPFLLKVLDVREMLSIQVHPSKESAEKEYSREHASGLSLDAPNRNYKDANHKPELMVALSDFWLLHGFKPAEELTDILLNVVELNELLPVFNNKGYPGLYRHVMELPQQEINRILGPLIENVRTIHREGKQEGVDEDYWAWRAASKYAREGVIDRGIISIYLFNLVHLKKGEGIFQAAGVPHAYLEGQNVEVMANSDNVLRGGLTTKHIDVPELLKHVVCEATWPRIIQGVKIKDGMNEYPVPADDFHLNAITLESGMQVSLRAEQDEVHVITEGSAMIRSGKDSLEMHSGEPAVYIEKDTDYILEGIKPARIYRAHGS